MKQNGPTPKGRAVDTVRHHTPSSIGTLPARRPVKGSSSDAGTA